MRALLTTLALLCMTASGMARIGETEKELIARYGREVGSGTGISNPAAPNTIDFDKSGFRIVVWLLHGKSGEEMIFKLPDQKISDLEVRTLLNDNAAGYTWKATEPGKGWNRDDGAKATYSNDRETFIVISKELIEANAQPPTKALDSSSLKGF